MTKEPFVDYYEILQLSPNADYETVERVFRMLAKRYHPDNEETGNPEKFNLVIAGHKVLSDPEKRAAYDVEYDKARMVRWKIFDETPSPENGDGDKKIQEGILSLLYTARRQDTLNPGIGIYELERLLGCPEKHMEFHIWYLKEKGWIQRMDSGEFSITAGGVDAVMENNLLMRKDRLLPESTGPSS
jgi:curved DNA-binding protein CbpA